MLQEREKDQRWHWRDMQLEVTYEYPTEEPAHPYVGCGWRDPKTGHLCIWSGTEWVCMPTD